MCGNRYNSGWNQCAMMLSRLGSIIRKRTRGCQFLGGGQSLVTGIFSKYLQPQIPAELLPPGYSDFEGGVLKNTMRQKPKLRDYSRIQRWRAMVCNL